MSNEVAETHDEEKCDLDTVKDKYPDISWKDGGRQVGFFKFNDDKKAAENYLKNVMLCDKFWNFYLITHTI